ncbi:hypothetical protein BKA70DRAFT_1416035 [Coprinopsis sp. MPI-PUGE-AT-0042]|nr:hypothetical protein BKA70DRAFT_1416035 [Coprinopsis sp. MPI-PUGE-AT-0042]
MLRHATGLCLGPSLDPSGAQEGPSRLLVACSTPKHPPCTSSVLHPSSTRCFWKLGFDTTCGLRYSKRLTYAGKSASNLVRGPSLSYVHKAGCRRLDELTVARAEGDRHAVWPNHVQDANNNQTVRNWFKCTAVVDVWRPILLLLNFSSSVSSTASMDEVTIHHLPVEIMMAVLSDIIEDHLVGVNEQYYILPNDGVRFYLKLSSVCRRWRDIIFSMASLWRSSGSFLWTTKPERVVARAREAIQKLTLWYGRAGQLPLSISITMPRCNTDGGPELCALNEYIVAIDRWEEITYTANAPLITSLLDMARRRRENPPFARLRSLTMSLSWNDNQKLGPLSTFAQTFAGLTELNLRLVLWDPNAFLAQLHFPSLTSLSLSLDRTPIDDVLLKQYILPVLLTQNPALQHLHLCHRFSTSHERRTTDITHSSLRSLEVEGHLVIEQFGMLTLPNLACLKINNQYNSDTHAASHGSAFVQSILDMIERSSCALTEFWTTSIRLLNSELVRLLTAMPTLRKLRMASWDHWPKNGRTIDDPGEVEAPDDMECDAPPKAGHFLAELYNHPGQTLVRPFRPFLVELVKKWTDPR